MSGLAVGLAICVAWVVCGVTALLVCEAALRRAEVDEVDDPEAAAQVPQIPDTPVELIRACYRRHP